MWKDFHQNGQHCKQMCHRTRKYTVCRRVRASFGPNILQVGAVKGLSKVWKCRQRSYRSQLQANCDSGLSGLGSKQARYNSLSGLGSKQARYNRDLACLVQKRTSYWPPVQANLMWLKWSYRSHVHAKCARGLAYLRSMQSVTARSWRYSDVTGLGTRQGVNL